MRVRRLAGARRSGWSPWPPRIGGGDCLIFTMEIIKIKGGTKPKVAKKED